MKFQKAFEGARNAAKRFNEPYVVFDRHHRKKWWYPFKSVEYDWVSLNCWDVKWAVRTGIRICIVCPDGTIVQ